MLNGYFLLKFLGTFRNFFIFNILGAKIFDVCNKIFSMGKEYKFKVRDKNNSGWGLQNMSLDVKLKTTLMLYLDQLHK